MFSFAITDFRVENFFFFSNEARQRSMGCLKQFILEANSAFDEALKLYTSQIVRYSLKTLMVSDNRRLYVTYCLCTVLL